MEDKRVIEQTASSEIYNDDWFLKDSVLEGTSKISGANLKELLGADGTLALEEIANAIAEEYDSTQTYAYNSWVFHEGALYRCITQSVTGTWDATKWQAKTIKEFIADSENLITSRLRAMFGEYLPISTLDPPYVAPISKGDIFIYQRTNRYKFYRAKADHPQGVTEFDIDDWDEFDTVADLIEDVTENAGKVDDVKVDGVSVVDENKVAQITTPDADGISYDNTTSGLEADDVQEAIDEVVGRVEDIEDKESTWDMVGSASGSIATFTDGADDILMKSLVAEIEPVQDLHGYDAPWPAGGGKNKIPNIPSSYTSGAVLVDYGSEKTFNGYALSFKFSGSFVNGGASFFIGKDDNDNNTIILTPQNMKKVSDGSSLVANTTYTNESVYFTSNANVNIRKFLLYTYPSFINPVFKDCQFENGNTVTTFEPYSNICPISGWDEANVGVVGKNRITSITEGIELNSADGTTKSNVSWYVADYTSVEYGKTYYVSGTSSATVCYYDRYKNFTRNTLSQRNITPQEGECYVRVNSLISEYAEPQIEEGNEATSFSPFGNTYTIDLDGTRYGGELDVVSGTMTVDRAYVDMGSPTWGYTNNRFYFNPTNAKVHTQQETANLLCSQYPTNQYTNQADNSISSYAGYIYVRADSYSGDTTAFKTAMNGVQLVYELATPLTIQLTPTAVKSLLGSNNVWADTGDIEKVEYVRDATSIINNILERLEALEG